MKNQPDPPSPRITKEDGIRPPHQRFTPRTSENSQGRRHNVWKRFFPRFGKIGALGQQRRPVQVLEAAFLEVEEAEWDRVVTTNLRGLLSPARNERARNMKKSIAPARHREYSGSGCNKVPFPQSFRLHRPGKGGPSEMFTKIPPQWSWARTQFASTVSLPVPSRPNENQERSSRSRKIMVPSSLRYGPHRPRRTMWPTLVEFLLSDKASFHHRAKTLGVAEDFSHKPRWPDTDYNP